MAGHRVLIVAAGLAAAALGGCGGGSSASSSPTTTTSTGSTSTRPAVVILDTKRVERAIEQSIHTERKVTARVDCPSGVHQGKGLTFDCTATTSGGAKTTFVVEQKDSKGNVTYRGR